MKTHRSPDLPPEPGSDLPGDLELLEVLSTSARGRVCRVRRPDQPGRDLILRIGPRRGISIAAEVGLFARLEAPGLVAPVEWGTTPGGCPYLLRPMVEGRPFASAARDASPEDVAAWTDSLLRTLAQLHAAGFVHRDIKSDNVLVGDDGVHLVDLDFLGGMEGAAAVAGSAVHIAPEVLLGRPHDASSDLFSTGVMLALALCGEPHPGFHSHFPRQSFWVASGLSPDGMDPDLGALVCGLVRRHPKDRPASAQAASRLLATSHQQLPDPCLPFLQGRESAAARLTDRLLSAEGVVVVSVEDPEEVTPLFDTLHVDLELSGLRVARLGDPAWKDQDAPRDETIRRLAEAGMDVVLADGSQADIGSDPEELALAFLVPTVTKVPRLCLVVAPSEARELGAALRRRHLDDEVAALDFASWPRLSRAALERHLAVLSDGASPGVGLRLAHWLHAHTGGRREDVNRLLASGVEAGVLRPAEGGYALLRQDWPDAGSTDAALVSDVARRTETERTALAAVACLDAPAEVGLVAAVLRAPVDATASALVGLATAGFLRREGELFVPREHRALAAARAALAQEALRAMHLRCAEVLEGMDAPPRSVARHLLAAATDVEALRRVLDVAQAELESGGVGAARALLQGVEGHALVGDADPTELDGPLASLCERIALLKARLELAQGRAKDALGVLTAAHGERLESAPVSVLLVAAHASEQCGRREDARALFRRALESPGDRADRLRALTGLGFGLFLDGAWEAALETTESEVLPDDPDDAAAGLLNLRGVALTRLRRNEEAEATLKDALARGRAARDPLSVARTELNLAHLDRRSGRTASAADGLARALASFGQAGHVQGRAMALNNLGVLHRDLGDLRRARGLLEESLALRRRVGDAHGAAATLGSLALLELDAGHVGSALATLARSHQLFAQGDHESELAMLDHARGLALALAGRHLEAAGLLAGPRAEIARREHASLAARTAAVVHLISGQRDLALSEAERAAQEAERAGDLAEGFRAACLLVALSRQDPAAASCLHQYAEKLGGKVRHAEAEFRTLSAHEAPSAAQLEGWLDVFEQAGRTDLIASVATLLAEVLDRSGDIAGRRRAQARAAEASDALADGLPVHEKDATLKRLARLVGAGPVAEGPRRLTLDWFLACNHRMASEQDLEGLLRAIMDMALDVTGGQRGFLVLMEGDAVSVEVARGMAEGGLPAEEARFSRTVVREAISTRAPVLTTDAAADRRFLGTESIGALTLRSVLCVPLLMPEGPGGALYIDHDQPFDDADAERLSSLADQAAVAILNLRRRQQIEALNRRLTERVELQQEELSRARSLLRRVGTVAPVGGLVGESEPMNRVYALVERFAPTDLPVLVTGASGSGKDLVARALHTRSRRAAGPFVVENLSALPANLLESELFGHVRGAFTGADRDRPGLFTEADGGSFFLDEIGEMPIELQAKLLRVLETGEVRPVGSRRTVHVDVRIIAATNRDLPARVRDGAFREDLYYRLNATEIGMPSLAERLEDIPLLVQHFLEGLNEKHGTDKQITEALVAGFVRRAWPGQVRELANEVRRVYFLSDDVLDDPGLLRDPARMDASADVMPASLRLEDVERAAIVRALDAAGGRKDKAARLLGISRAGLYAKLKRLEIGTERRDEA